jgi:sulfoxide reductase heme-binding subunit YedZ
MVTAVELSADVALGAVALLATNVLLGLLLAAGYNPVRNWPRRRIKIFTLHNWTGYLAVAAAMLHPAILLFSSKPPFRIVDVLVPLKSPVQPTSNTLGAIALYLVVAVVLTSYFRTALGRHRWKAIHYSAYAAAAVFFVHGVIADPTVSGRAVDYLDGEKVFVEGSVVLVAAATLWRVRHRRALRSRS